MYLALAGDRSHPMPKFETRHPVPHTARQMYDLVADVEAYPQFLPLCDVLKVKSRAPHGAAGEVLTCAMEVGYGPIRERFTTRVTLDPEALHIHSTYIDGPFRRMDNTWRFEDKGAGRFENQGAGRAWHARRLGFRRLRVLTFLRSPFTIAPQSNCILPA